LLLVVEEAERGTSQVNCHRGPPRMAAEEAEQVLADLKEDEQPDRHRQETTSR